MSEAEATTEEAPAARPMRSGRRRPPPRSKSVEDSGSLAQMRASRNGDKTGEAAAEGGDAAEGARPRRGGRRAPARTKSADDMAAMVRMRKKKSKDESKDGEEKQ